MRDGFSIAVQRRRSAAADERSEEGIESQRSALATVGCSGWLGPRASWVAKHGCVLIEHYVKQRVEKNIEQFSDCFVIPFGSITPNLLHFPMFLAIVSPHQL
jgi:hypothetical protein